MTPLSGLHDPSLLFSNKTKSTANKQLIGMPVHDRDQERGLGQEEAEEMREEALGTIVRGTLEAPSLEDEPALAFAQHSGALGVPTQVRSTAFTGHRTGPGAQGLWRSRVNIVPLALNLEAWDILGPVCKWQTLPGNNKKMYCCLRICTLGGGALTALGTV